MQRNGRFAAAFTIFLSGMAAVMAQSDLLQQYGTADGLPSAFIYALHTDARGRVWFGTQQGATVFSGGTFRSHLGEETITGFAEAPPGRLWCHTAAGALYYLEGGSFRPWRHNDRTAEAAGSRIVNSVRITGGGEVYLTTVIGGHLFRIGSDGREEHLEPGEDSYTFFAVNAGGGPVSGAVSRSNPDHRLLAATGNKPYLITLSARTGYSRTVCIRLSSGSYLFAKDHEIVCFNDTAMESRVFVEKSVEALYEDGDGKVWVGLSRGGVLCYPAGIRSSDGRIHYLGNRAVTGIAEDGDGNMWFATAGEGAFLLPAAPRLSYTPPPLFSGDGEAGKKTQAALRSVAGIALMTGPGYGAVVTMADSARADTIPPAIYITGVELAGTDTAVLESYELPHDRNHIGISFAGIAFGRSGSLQYRYKLEPAGSGWTYTNATSVRFLNLKPGAYRFYVNAMNHDGYWSVQPATVSFTVLPPFWHSPWFYTALVAAAALTLSAWVLLRQRRKKKKDAEEAALSRRIAGIELQALRAQMNPHFIFNTLNSIQHYIAGNEAEPAIRYLSKFARLIRSIMDNSRRTAIPLKDELDALAIYLDLEKMRFKDKFDYRFSIDENIDPAAVDIPPLLLQPYVENAIWHGLMHKEGSGVITVSLTKNGSRAVCSIEDDGIGRKRSAELRRTGHVSKGMLLTGERISLINAVNNTGLAVEVTDLYGEGNIAAGTRVNVYIPLD